MKRFLVPLLLLAVALVAPAANVLINVRDFSGGAVAGRTATVTLVRPAGAVVGGSWLIAGDTVSQRTDANGQTTFSNLMAVGEYRLDITGNPSRSFPFSLDATATGTVSVVNVINYFGTNVSVQKFYNTDQVDALINGAITSNTNSISAQLATNISAYQAFLATNSLVLSPFVDVGVGLAATTNGNSQHVEVVAPLALLGTNNGANLTNLSVTTATIPGLTNMVDGEINNLAVLKNSGDATNINLRGTEVRFLYDDTYQWRINRNGSNLRLQDPTDGISYIWGIDGVFTTPKLYSSTAIYTPTANATNVVASTVSSTTFVAGGSYYGDGSHLTNIVASTTNATSFDNVSDGVSSGKALTVGNGTILKYTGTGKIQATGSDYATNLDGNIVTFTTGGAQTWGGSLKTNSLIVQPGVMMFTNATGRAVAFTENSRLFVVYDDSGTPRFYIADNGQLFGGTFSLGGGGFSGQINLNNVSYTAGRILGTDGSKNVVSTTDGSTLWGVRADGGNITNAVNTATYVTGAGVALTNGVAAQFGASVAGLAGGLTNSGGYSISNAIFGIIAGANVTITTNNGVVTITPTGGGSGTGLQTNGGTGLNNLMTNLTVSGGLTSTNGTITSSGDIIGTNKITAMWSGSFNGLGSGLTNATGQQMNNGIFGIINGGGMTITTNAGIVTMASTGTGTGMSTNGGTGINNLMTNTTFSGGIVTTNGGLTSSGDIVGTNKITAMWSGSFQGLASGLTNANGNALSDKTATNQLQLDLSAGLVKLWSVHADSGNLTSTIPIGILSGPLQLLSTNFVGSSVTNAAGQVIANAVQGIIQTGASTNTHVVTLPPAGIQTNGGTGQNLLLTNLTTYGGIVSTGGTFTSSGDIIGTNKVTAMWNGGFYGNGVGLTNVTAANATYATNYQGYIYSSNFNTTIYLANENVGTLAAGTEYGPTNNTYLIPSAWSGATNNLNLNIGRQSYTAASDMWVSNYANGFSSLPQQVWMIITNSVATNCVLRFPVASDQGVSSVNCPAGLVTTVLFDVGASTNVYNISMLTDPLNVNTLNVGTLNLTNALPPSVLQSTNTPTADKVYAYIDSTHGYWATAGSGTGSSNITDSGYIAVIRNAYVSTNFQVAGSGNSYFTNPVVLVSNTAPTVASLGNGGVGFWNSNGAALYAIITNMVTSTTTTNQIVPVTASGSGTGISTNGGTGINNEFTNAVLSGLTLQTNGTLISSNWLTSAGPGLMVTNFSQTIAAFTANTNWPAQVWVKNYNTSTNASSRFTAESGSGDAGMYYAAFGINQTNFSSATNALGSTNDGYVFVKGSYNGSGGGSLYVGVVSTNNALTNTINFTVGNPSNTVAYISTNSLVVKGSGGSKLYGDSNQTNWLEVTTTDIRETNAVGFVALIGDSVVATNRLTGNSVTSTNGLVSSKQEEFTTNTITTGNGTATMDMLKKYSMLQTNAAITISLANVPTSTDRSSLLILSNSANGGTILVTCSGFSVLTNGVPTQTFYVTNLNSKRQVTHLTVNCYAGFLTNGVATPFYDP